ncbi:MAG: prolipoprotein diacylglyceryl transferase [Rhodobacteraceae bacterium]|nr:prolipoprotein diacylglyceryl transferase [Paracoccaceae bacterium]
MMTETAIILPYINPEIVSLDLGVFTLTLRWYSCAYIVGFLIGWFWFVRLMRKREIWPDGTAPMPARHAESLLTWNIIGIILGGRLGYVSFYNPLYFLGSPWEIVMIWNGGMSFHGAFIGLILATILFCRRNGYPLGSVSDAIAIVVTPGLGLGRVANFINAELYGRPTTSLFGVVFPWGPASGCPPGWSGLCTRHPTQLYEALLEGAVLGILLYWLATRRFWLQQPWRIAGMFFFGYGSMRFLVEFLRQPDMQFITAENPAGTIIDLGMLGGLTMGQLLSLPMIGIGLFLFRFSQTR